MFNDEHGCSLVATRGCDEEVGKQAADGLTNR